MNSSPSMTFLQTPTMAKDIRSLGPAATTALLPMIYDLWLLGGYIEIKR